MNRSDILVCVAAYFVIGAASVMGAKWYVNISAPISISNSDVVDIALDQCDEWESFHVPGISQPATIPAHDAALEDLAEVVGIVVQGQARAYQIDAMSMPAEAMSESGPEIEYFLTRHVVNDFVSGRCHKARPPASGPAGRFS